MILTARQIEKFRNVGAAEAREDRDRPTTVVLASAAARARGRLSAERGDTPNELRWVGYADEVDSWSTTLTMLVDEAQLAAAAILDGRRPAGPALSPEATALAESLAGKLEALADGDVPHGQRYALVQLVRDNLDTLARWVGDDRS